MKVKVSPKVLIAAGLAVFVFGLLVVAQEKTLSQLMMQIVPDSQTAVVFGAVVVSVGQAIVVFGAVKLASAKFLTGLESERQLTTAAFAKGMEQLQVKWQSERQTLMAGYTQTMAKLDNLISSQREANANPKVNLPSNCRFCGARIEQGYFCTKCGKSNR